MQLFLFLNGLAGRSPFVDQVVRFFYIGAVPLLATLLLAQLLLVAPRGDAPSRKSVLLALTCSLLMVALTDWALGWISQSWGLGNISTRPYMTRWVNLLIVEPQDNSFPCLEVMVAAIITTGMAILNRKWGMAGAIVTVFLAFARMFCGTNYLADVLVGGCLGIGTMSLFLAAFGAPARLFFGRRSQQFAFSGTVLVTTVAGTYLCMLLTPRLASKIPSLFSSPANATIKPELSQSPTKAASGVLQEGEAEGAAMNEEGGDDAEAISLTKRSHLFLPNVEKYLSGRLAPLARPFRLLDVEVAPVRAGNTTYRCAALRFEISRQQPDLRRQTAEVAAKLVKGAFANDSQLQNVDVTAIVRGNGEDIDGSTLKFVGDEVPVFTASIQRINLILAQPRWANAPNLDGGSWLRTRSRLYVNEKVLPASLESKSEPVPTPVPAIVQPIAPTARPPVTAIPLPTATSAAKAITPTIRPAPTQTKTPLVNPFPKPHRFHRLRPRSSRFGRSHHFR